MRRPSAVFCLAALLLGEGGGARAQEEKAASLGRQMKMGIYFYEKGDDTQAMDRFMEVLTQGDPAERSMANEYMNMINHRMNTGERLPAPGPKADWRGSEGEAPRRQAVLVEPAAPAAAAKPAAAPPPAPVPAAAAAALPAEAPAPPPRWAPPAPIPVDRALMKREIKAKLRRLEETALKELKAQEGVRVLSLENGDPQAIGIPASLLFGAGISFQRDASQILDALIRLVFSLGGAQAVILPEGTALGDAKIQDMRRTMGVASQFYSAGIAPPRVRVNLLNSQVELPKALADFKGVVILFVYDQPLSLIVENPIGDEGGPPLSLGVYPGSLCPDKAEGSVIEFSVLEPAAGLVSWKFQLLQPSSADGRDLAPLQDVVGGSPVFHQIYWNGRQNYFGPALPAGRYECVLTATDGKNRQKTLHRWIQLAGAAPARASSAPIVVTQAPSAELPGAAPAKPSALIKGGRPPAVKPAKKGAAKKSAKKAKKSPPKAAPAKAAAPEKPDSGQYRLEFSENSYQLAAEGEKTLARIAETLAYYPMESLRITGTAQSSEPEAKTLAEKRAQLVAGLLINKYRVEPKKIQVDSNVTDAPSHRVVVDFVANE